MAQRSKRAKYHGQVKRENSLLKQQLLFLDRERVKSTTIALLLLGKAGGDVVIEKAFLDGIQSQIPFMGYESKLTEAGDMQIKAVVNEAAMAVAMEAVAEAQSVDAASSEPAIVLTDGE